MYEKGSEIVRLYATLLGKDGFRAGMDLYFKRHDGCAVTCDDFYSAMADANKNHPAAPALPALARWYGQAGTPRLKVSQAYDAAARTLTLTASQSTPATPGQPAEGKVPVLIPIAVGLLGADGADLPLTLSPSTAGTVDGTTAILRLTDERGVFVFTNVPVAPVVSVLRGFSAPVILDIEGQTDADLVFLVAHDSDEFNRFEAGQRFARSVLLARYADAVAALAGAPELGKHDSAALEAAVARAIPHPFLPSSFVDALKTLLADPRLDGAFIARATTLPSDSELVEAVPGGAVDPVLLAAVRSVAAKTLAKELAPTAAAVLDRIKSHADFAAGAIYSPSFDAVARRALRNKCFSFIALADGGEATTAAAAARAAAASNMTDAVAALAVLVDAPLSSPARNAALDAFAKKWASEPLVLLKWFSLQAMGTDATTVVKALSLDARFSITNPNACYSLYGAYSGNAPAFHAADGSGYALLADAVLAIDAVNAQVAARIVSGFNKFRKHDAARQELVRSQLIRLRDSKLSENVAEIVARALA